MSDDMVINLSKGQTIDLTKKAPRVRKYYVGMSWETEADLDVSVFPCRITADGSSELVSPPWFIFYNNLESPDKAALIHSIDAREGAGADTSGLDDEYILIDLDKIESLIPDCRELSFVVTIDGAPSNGERFGQVKNAFIRVVPLESFDKSYDKDGNPVASNVKLGTGEVRYDLKNDASDMSAVQFGSLTKDATTGNWSFEAVGQGYLANLDDVIHQYMPNAKTAGAH